jgi:hypothetical protein
MSNQSPLPAELPARVERVRERNFNTHTLNLPNGFLVIFEQRAKPAKWEKRMQSSAANTESGRQISVLHG